MKNQHVKVLLWKDFRTIKRNWGFLVTFILIPFIMMGSFSYMEHVMTAGVEPMEHNFIHSTYAKMMRNGGFLKSNMNIQDMKAQLYNVSTLASCVHIDRNEIGLVVPPKMLNQTQPFFKSFASKQRFKPKYFDTQEDLFHDVRTNVSSNMCFAVMFSDMSKDALNVNITMMFPRDVVYDTYSPFYDESIRAPNLKAWNATMISGMPQLMVYMTNVLAFFYKGDRFWDIQMGFIPMKTPDFPQLDMFATQMLTDQFPLFFMFTFLMPLYYLVTKLAEEKQSRAREGMHMMGLSQGDYFAGWFAFLFIIILLITAIIIGVTSHNVFVQSDFILIAIMSIAYGMTLFGFSFIIVSFLPNKRTASTAASLIHFTSFYVSLFVSGSSVPKNTKMIASLIPNVAMSLAAQNMFHFEIESTGLSWTYAFKEYNNYSFALGVAMLIFDMVLYAGLGFYFDQVLPKDFGITSPWYFPLLPSTYFGKSNKPLSLPSNESHKIEIANFEKISDQQSLKQIDSNQCLKIRGLSKRYNNGGPLAVDEVSMTMFPGEIFVLLGHNGAGKTSTISVLTGLLEATQGQAELNSVAILDDMEEFRDNLGLCPQHNILFDYLTVQEHLYLYGVLKEIPQDRIEKRITKVLAELELFDVENQLASTLSGGQKRKLSVGIALIGNPKILMLDEPTSGMDTSTRRKFWDILKEYKKNRIVILTTHYMDEADMLGDRICIMAEGKVHCTGSSLFLKDRFGIGYNVNLAKKDQKTSNQVDQFFKKELPEAIKVQDSNSEIVFQIPAEASGKFTKFFQLLDKNLDTLKISSYGVGKTTLEDVFLKIGHGKDDDRQGALNNKINSNQSDLSVEQNQYSISKPENRDRSFVRQYLSLMRKHLLMIRRDKKTFLIDLLFPVLLIGIGLYLSTIDFMPDNSPARVLNPRGFPGPRPLIYNKDNYNQTSDTIQEFVEQQFGNKPELFSELIPLEFDNDKHFYENMALLDDYIYDHKEQFGGMYGTYWFQQINRTDAFYSIANVVNMTAPTATLSYAAEALQACLRDYSGKEDINLTFLEQPLPYSLKLKGFLNTALGTISAVLFAISFMMISDAVIQNVIKERTSNVKHHIILSGCNVYAYWLAQYSKDIIMHGIPSLISIKLVHEFEIDVPQCEFLFLYFVLSNPLFLYSISFLFDSDSKGSVLVRVFYFVVGAILPLTIQILQVINPKTQLASEFLKHIGLQFIPIFSLDYGYLSIMNREVMARVGGNEDYLEVQPLDWQVAGHTQFCLQLTFVIYGVILITKESGHLARFIKWFVSNPLGTLIIVIFSLPYDLLSLLIDIGGSNQEAMVVDDLDREEEDEDVAMETERVSKLPQEQAVVHIKNLYKTYDLTTIAVNDLNFAIDHGQCFGLLGVTGAGKTSTFKCITGEEVPDSGSKLYVGGHDVQTKEGFEQAKSLIGYCPQFDNLFENLTVQEHFEFFADMKGIKSEIKQTLIENQLKNMDLVGYKDVYATNLSGGNKRKLSCAIALLGNPEVIILDEPSTGVDPQAKRFMWDIISNIPKYHSKSCVILTTHSMEEAEALCHKMGIMTGGKFKCFGTSQNLKDKLGTAYEIEFKLDLNITEDIVKETVASLGYFTTHFTKDQMRNMLESMQCDYLFEQICPDGIGAQLDKEFDKNGKCAVRDLVRWTLNEKGAFSVIQKLRTIHSSVSIVEQYQSQYKLKVSRDNHTIGYLFGLLESIKDEYKIVNYSVSQTSIEQIFNNLAREDQLRKQRARLRQIKNSGANASSSYHTKQD